MRSHVGPVLLLTLLTVLLAGLVYLAHHPEAEALQRAEGWPFVGPLATAFRERFTPPPPPVPEAEEPAAEEAVHVIHVAPVVPPLGQGEVWVLPGNRIRSEPSPTAPTVVEFEAIANVTWLEKKGDWYRVWHRGAQGWVYLEGYVESDEPPYGRAVEPPGPLPPRAPEPETLEAALAHLGDGGRRLQAGPWTLWTDTADVDLLERLQGILSGLEAVYTARYGRKPLGTPLEVVVLYDDEAVYREIQAGTEGLLGLVAAGHTVSGLSLSFVGGRSHDAVAATIVHELVHTINRRALGPVLPSWLDEGIAEDLATSRLGPAGPLPGTLSGERRAGDGTFTLSGGIAALYRLRDQVRTASLPSVENLVALDWEAFVRPGAASLHYAQAAFFLRFLLDGEDGRYAEGFRSFLAGVAAGESVAGPVLLRHLDESWTVLNARFQLWLELHKFPEVVITEPG